LVFSLAVLLVIGLGMIGASVLMERVGPAMARLSKPTAPAQTAAVATTAATPASAPTACPEPGEGATATTAPAATETATSAVTDTPTPKPAPTDACPHLVRRQGENLVLNGEPITFVGINATLLMSPVVPDHAVTSILAELSDWGVNLVRFWVWPGSDMNRVRHILDEGGARRIRFVVTLQDYYYYKDVTWFADKYRTEDLPHIEKMVTEFRDRPEIAIWEVMNEPWCGGNNEADDPNCFRVLEAWARDTTGLIRRLDPCRPISLGTSWERFTPVEKEGYRWLQSIDTVDIVSLHREAENWYNYPSEINLAHELGKPVMIGEIWEWAYADACKQRYDGVLNDRAAKLDKDMHKALEMGVDAYLLWDYAAGPFPEGSDNPQYFCGQNSYWSGDPVAGVIRALPIPRPEVTR